MDSPACSPMPPPRRQRPVLLWLILLLVVGYFAPLPPARKAEDAALQGAAP